MTKLCPQLGLMPLLAGYYAKTVALISVNLEPGDKAGSRRFAQHVRKRKRRRTRRNKTQLGTFSLKGNSAGERKSPANDKDHPVAGERFTMSKNEPPQLGVHRIVMPWLFGPIAESYMIARGNAPNVEWLTPDREWTGNIFDGARFEMWEYKTALRYLDQEKRKFFEA